MRVYIILACVALAVVEVAHCCDRNVNIDCSSVNYQYKTCTISNPGAYNDVKIIQKYSKSSCTKGRTYGFKSNHVWVSNGCRGKFNVCICKKYRVVDCDSQSYRYKECYVHGASNVTYVQLASKKSKSACTKNYSYGITGNKIWVHHGCRARFHVCYQ